MTPSERNRIFLENVGLLKKLTKDLWCRFPHLRRYGTFEDIYQDAAFVMLRAIDKFDPKRGCELSTYVGVALRNSVTFFGLVRGLIHVPLHAVGSDLHRATERIAGLKFDLCDGRSFSGEVEDRMDLGEALQRLPLHERRTIEFLFGLDGKPRRTERELAVTEGITYQAISARKVSALKRLRKGME